MLSRPEYVWREWVWCFSLWINKCVCMMQRVQLPNSSSLRHFNESTMPPSQHHVNDAMMTTFSASFFSPANAANETFPAAMCRTCSLLGMLLRFLIQFQKNRLHIITLWEFLSFMPPQGWTRGRLRVSSRRQRYLWADESFSFSIFTLERMQTQLMCWL